MRCDGIAPVRKVDRSWLVQSLAVWWFKMLSRQFHALDRVLPTVLYQSQQESICRDHTNAVFKVIHSTFLNNLVAKRNIKLVFEII